MSLARQVAALQAAAEQARNRGGFTDYLEALDLLERARELTEQERVRRVREIEGMAREAAS